MARQQVDDWIDITDDWVDVTNTTPRTDLNFSTALQPRKPPIPAGKIVSDEFGGEINLKDIRRKLRVDPKLKEVEYPYDIQGTGGLEGPVMIPRFRPERLDPDFDYGEFRTPTKTERLVSTGLGTVPSIVGILGGVPGVAGGSMLGSELRQQYELERGLRSEYNPELTELEGLFGVAPGLTKLGGTSARELGKYALKSGAENAVISAAGTPYFSAAEGHGFTTDPSEYGWNALTGFGFGATLSPLIARAGYRGQQPNLPPFVQEGAGFTQHPPYPTQSQVPPPPPPSPPPTYRQPSFDIPGFSDEAGRLAGARQPVLGGLFPPGHGMPDPYLPYRESPWQPDLGLEGDAGALGPASQGTLDIEPIGGRLRDISEPAPLGPEELPSFLQPGFQEPVAPPPIDTQPPPSPPPTPIRGVEPGNVGVKPGEDIQTQAGTQNNPTYVENMKAGGYKFIGLTQDGLKAIWRSEQGAIDPNDELTVRVVKWVYEKLRNTLGRDLSAEELDAAVAEEKRIRGPQIGEETGRVAPFKGQPGSPEFDQMAGFYDDQITTQGGKESLEMMPGIEREITEEEMLYGGTTPEDEYQAMKPPPSLERVQPDQMYVSEMPPEQGQLLPMEVGEPDTSAFDADLRRLRQQHQADILARAPLTEPEQLSMEGQMKDAEIADYLRQEDVITPEMMDLNAYSSEKGQGKGELAGPEPPPTSAHDEGDMIPWHEMSPGDMWRKYLGYDRRINDLSNPDLPNNGLTPKEAIEYTEMKRFFNENPDIVQAAIAENKRRPENNPQWGKYFRLSDEELQAELIALHRQLDVNPASMYPEIHRVMDEVNREIARRNAMKPGYDPVTGAVFPKEPPTWPKSAMDQMRDKFAADQARAANLKEQYPNATDQQLLSIIRLERNTTRLKNKYGVDNPQVQRMEARLAKKYAELGGNGSVESDLKPPINVSDEYSNQLARLNRGEELTEPELVDLLEQSTKLRESATAPEIFDQIIQQVMDRMNQFDKPSRRLQAEVDSIAARNPPDIAFREVLPESLQTPLREGETWQARVQALIRRFIEEEEGAISPAQIIAAFGRAGRRLGIGQGLGRPKPSRQTNPHHYSTFAEALQFPSAATTTGDFSVMLRQALPLINTRHFWQAILPASKSLSFRHWQQVDNAIRAEPIHQRQFNPNTGQFDPSTAEKIGLDLFVPASQPGPRSQAVASRWLETGAWLGGERWGGTLNPTTGVRTGGIANPLALAWKHSVGYPIRATNRFFLTFLNHAKTHLAQKLMDRGQDMSLEALQTGKAREGIMPWKTSFTRAEALDLDPYRNLQRGKEIGEFVNAASGQAKGVNFLEKSAEAIGKALFSPGLLVSRVRLLNPHTYVMATPFVRKQYAKAAIGAVMGWGTMMAVAKAAAEAMGKDHEIVDDWTNADFGKFRIGNTRLDFGGGFLQFAVLIGRMIEGGWTSSSNPEEGMHRFGEGFQAETQLSNFTRFVSNKLNPIAKFAWDVADASEGKPFQVGDRLAQLFVPLFVQDLMEIWKEDPDLLPWMTPVMFGGGTQTYEKGEAKGKFFAPEDDWTVTGGGLRDLIPGGDNEGFGY